MGIRIEGHWEETVREHPNGGTIVERYCIDPVVWVGDMPYPWAQVQAYDVLMPPMRLVLPSLDYDETEEDRWHRRRSGLWLFENSWSLSAIWGDGNYCANKYAGAFGMPSDVLGMGRVPFMEDCPNAEIALRHYATSDQRIEATKTEATTISLGGVEQEWPAFPGHDLIDLPGGDTVQGWVSAEAVGDLLQRMQTWPSHHEAGHTELLRWWADWDLPTYEEDT